MADHFALSVVSTRKTCRHLVLKELGLIHTGVEMPNGTGNFRNFQISRKKDNLERWTKIFETNFRKLSVPFDLNRNSRKFWSNGMCPLAPYVANVYGQ